MKVKGMKAVSMLMIGTCILCSLSIAGIVAAHNKDTAVVYINDEPLSLREYTRVVLEKKAGVFEYFKQKYNAGYDRDFWSSSFNGEIPGDYLKEKALEECIKIKAQQILAKEKGIQKDISYAAFIKDFQKENRRRQKAVKNNEIIYGPVEYKEGDYFNHIFSKAVISLKEKLKGNEIAVDDKELQDFYLANKLERYGGKGYLKVNIIALSFLDKDLKEDRALKADMKRKIEDAYGQLRSGGNFDEVAAVFNQNGKVIEQEFTDETARINDRNRIYQVASKLPVGSISEVFEGNGSFNIVKCVRKDLGEAKPYEDIKHQVESDYIKERYDSMVRDMLEKVRVNIVRKVYDNISIL